MKTIYRFRIRPLMPAALLLLALVQPQPAHAVSKEIVELQTQVQQLMDMMQRLQSTLDARLGVLQHLAEQTADEANRTESSMNALEKKLLAQSDAAGQKLDTASGQIQSVNDSVDEVKARLSKLEKSINDLQTQLQNAQQAVNPGAGPAGQPADNGQPAQPGQPPMSSAQMPPLEETFQAGLRDYNAAKYPVATGEFEDVVRYYPNDDRAGAAQFYLGEIAYRQQDYGEAVKQYSSMLDGFPGHPKAASARLHKGLALIQSNKRDAGIKELRQLIQRSPQTPEAAQARSKLNGMGIRVAPAR